jgi:hypothetical protein
MNAVSKRPQKKPLYVFEAQTRSLTKRCGAWWCGCYKARLLSGWRAALLLAKAETGASLPYV